MSELDHNAQDTSPDAQEAKARASLELVLERMAVRDPGDKNSPIPNVDRATSDIVTGPHPIPTEVLVNYATALKFEQDALSAYSEDDPNYWSKLEKIGEMSVENLRRLYEFKDADTPNPLIEMLTYQVSKINSAALLRSSLDIMKKVYEASTIPELTHTQPDDTVLMTLIDALRNGDIGVYNFYMSDTGSKGLKAGSQERRAWMRDTVLMATDLTDPNQADAYIYSISRSTMGEYNITAVVDRINSYGSAKLQAIQEFANITALSSYSNEQLDRMYKLAQGNETEIERLKEHDVTVALINMDGDHNGVSLEVAQRLDDDAERTLFFEITKPQQIYTLLKKLSDLGILPTTLIFASHGSAGQYFISERPAIGSDQLTDHIAVVIDQELADHVSSDDDKLIGYEIANANGLIRSIQRFMQPSRAIDDPDKDEGRKKIISLSCEFDGDTHRAGLGPDGESVRRGKTTLLRRLGETIVNKLDGEHIDIYGAVISTNQQTRTDEGFHYNQIRDGRWAPYPASVLHIDGKETQWHRLNEVKLRKPSVK